MRARGDHRQVGGIVTHMVCRNFIDTCPNDVLVFVTHAMAGATSPVAAV